MPENKPEKRTVICRKCNATVINTQKEKWTHALTVHTGDVVNKMAEKIAENQDGESGLFEIGHSLGKRMQADGVTPFGLAQVIMKGLQRAKNN